MASVQKFKQSAVVNILRHNNRQIKKPSNADIDMSKHNLNYRLSPDRGMDDYSYYQKRKNEVYCYNRSDVVTMAGWVITAPSDLPKTEHEDFFFHTYNFLKSRYGAENVVQAIVHGDESGEPHLHFCFIPVVSDQKRGGEKICAKEVLTKKELRDFHPALQSYLNSKGLNANVHTGVTAAQGGNRTVAEMKKEREIEKTIAQQVEIEKPRIEKIEVQKTLNQEKEKSIIPASQTSRWKTLDKTERTQERSRW